MDEQEKQALQSFVDELSALSDKHGYKVSNVLGYQRGFAIYNSNKTVFGFTFNLDTMKYESEELK